MGDLTNDGLRHSTTDGVKVCATEDRALLRITTCDADAEAILDRDAVVVGSASTGYEVTAPWAITSYVTVTGRVERQAIRWHSAPTGTLIMGAAGLAVSTCVLIEACLAAPNRTVRLADLPQLARGWSEWRS